MVGVARWHLQARCKELALAERPEGPGLQGTRGTVADEDVGVQPPPQGIQPVGGAESVTATRVQHVGRYVQV